MLKLLVTAGSGLHDNLSILTHITLASFNGRLQLCKHRGLQTPLLPLWCFATQLHV